MKHLYSYISLIALILYSTQLQAQYCTSNPTSNAYESIQRVQLVGNTLTLDNVTNTPIFGVCETYSDHTALTPADLSAGRSYTLTVTATSCSTFPYTHRTLAWIDYNKDNIFTANEAVVANALTGATLGFVFVFNFTVPCNVTAGNTRMRIVMIESATFLNPANSCGTYTWGETEDYTVNLQIPTSLSANFVAPSNAWVKSVVKFVNNNPTGYISHAWDADNNGTIEAPNSVNFNHIWTTNGTKCVKLRSTNCAGSDSIVKCLTVNTPTVVPIADFVSNSLLVEQFSTIKLNDLSQFGPYQWVWKVYDSSDVNNVRDINSGAIDLENGTTLSSQDPELLFLEPGCYTVELICTNDIGSSTMKKKTCYITVTLPTDYLLGFGTFGPNQDNVVESPSGTIIDNGGTDFPYTNRQGLGTRSFIRITPCNAKKITLKMSQLKFAGTGDRLRVWDGKSPGGAGTTLLTTWTLNNTSNRTVTATSGSMYVLFESDNSGTDSGYIGTYVSELGPATVNAPSFSPSSITGANNAPIKFTNTSQNVIGVPKWEWTIDGDPVSSQENLNYRFTTDQTYSVCLEVKSCVGSAKTCTNYSITTPQTATDLDVTASTRRPNVGVDRVSLMPKSETANRFEWTIFPTTYTLLNAPSGVNGSSGFGFVRYTNTPGDSLPTPVVTFTSPGCYTITLKAWNSNNPSATTKTVVKNRFICALDYCAPTAFIQSNDLAINNVTIKDGSIILLEKATNNPVSPYSNYGNTEIADLTFGKTYTLEIFRSSSIDPANRKGWIDWNIDGDFDDADEEIFFEPSSNNKTYNTTITVPSVAKSFEGLSRMRIAINYSNQNTVACGPATAGEYHDYGINLYRDNSKPVISLLGNSVVRLQVNGTYTDAGATAFDASEGDITSKIVTTNDLDLSVTGIYTYEYNVTDQSGNMAASVTRTIVVVTNLEPPVLNLIPGIAGCIQAKRDNGSYVEPGATANGLNPFIVLTSAIVRTGSVDTRKVGTYLLTYKVSDLVGNFTIKTRTVCVEDTKSPAILTNGVVQIQIGSLWIDQTTAKDDYDDMPILTKTWFPEPLNPTLKGTYTATYTAKDHEGNISAPVVVDYRVDDFIAPIINLNTFDEIEHEVSTPYNSVKATVIDNYYGTGQVSISKISSNVNVNILGKYTEVFKAVDGSGNVALKTRIVNVVDKTSPVLYGGTIYGCVGEDIWPMSGLTSTDNYYGPQILLSRVEIISQNVNSSQEGTYYITYRVIDPSDNVSALLTRAVVYTYWPRCFNSTVGLNEKSIEESVVIYPNPSTGLVNIGFNGAIAKNPKVQVINNLGQVVKSMTYNEAVSEINVDLTALAKGIYTINIISEGTVITKKISLM